MLLRLAESFVDDLVFDLDGTLIDSAPGLVSALRRTVATVLPERSVEIDESIIGPTIRVLFRQLLGEVDPRVMERLVATFRVAYDEEGYRDTRLYGGVIETLEALAANGVRCFVLTNKPAAVTGRILEHLDLARFFVATLSPDGMQPPFERKAQGLAHLVSRYGIRPDRAALIGDSRDDLEAAEAEGLRFFAVAYGYGDVHQGRTPVLASFSELCNPDLWMVRGTPG